MPDDRRTPRVPPLSRGRGITAFRVGLPVSLGIAGIIAISVGTGHPAVVAAGIVILGVGILVAMINWMFRLSVESNRERDAEEDARDYYTEHGHWPGEGNG